MKKSAFVLAVVLLFAGVTAGYSQGNKSQDKETTVKGEVVDVSCYLAHGKNGTGDNHKSCAEACAQHGGPLGILTSDGKLYVSVMPDDHKTGPNEILMNHIAHQITATGKVRTKNGVRGIMITKVDMADSQNQDEKK
jgi:hypothetical protein